MVAVDRKCLAARYKNYSNNPMIKLSQTDLPAQIDVKIRAPLPP